MDVLLLHRTCPLLSPSTFLSLFKKINQAQPAWCRPMNQNQSLKLLAKSQLAVCCCFSFYVLMLCLEVGIFFYPFFCVIRVPFKQKDSCLFSNMQKSPKLYISYFFSSIFSFCISYLLMLISILDCSPVPFIFYPIFSVSLSFVETLCLCRDS